MAEAIGIFISTTTNQNTGESDTRIAVLNEVRAVSFHGKTDKLRAQVSIYFKNVEDSMILSGVDAERFMIAYTEYFGLRYGKEYTQDDR